MQEYNLIDQQIHQLSQIIAKVSRSFVPKKDDDSHTNLYFDPLSHRLYGRWIDTPKGLVILALNISGFNYEILDANRTILHSIEAEGKTYDVLEGLVANSLSDLGLDVSGVMEPLHFEIPVYPFLAETLSSFTSESLSIWEKQRSLANQASYWLLGYLQTDSELRIWPHHFDTGIYTEVNSSISLGFGLAMTDSIAGGPYFYLSGYGLNDHTISYESLSDLPFGKWVVGENWKGAVLSIEEMKGDQSKLQEFLVSASQWFLKI